MSTAEFLCVGRGHQVRFSEDFDEVLTSAIQTTPDPLNAARELDDVALLTVLANFAGEGPYAPGRSIVTDRYSLLQVDDADQFADDHLRSRVRGGVGGSVGPGVRVFGACAVFRRAPGRRRP